MSVCEQQKQQRADVYNKRNQHTAFYVKAMTNKLGCILQRHGGEYQQNNGEHIRINIPPLTEDRRKELVKKAKAAGESAKISIRNSRRDANELLKKAQKDGLPEDVAKDAEAKIQKEVDNYNSKVDTILAAKEKEILTV